MATPDTLHTIYLSIRRGLARAVSNIVPPREIEDIVQETYVRICEVNNVELIRHPRSFLYKTARNLALDHVKRAEQRLSVNLSDEELDESLRFETDGYDSIYDQVAAKQEFEQFCEAVRHLPLQCRRVFVMKKVYGFTQKEIARDLNISENTVEKHIATGIRRCRVFMSQRGAIDEGESLDRRPGAKQ